MHPGAAQLEHASVLDVKQLVHGWFREPLSWNMRLSWTSCCSCMVAFVLHVCLDVPGALPPFVA